MATTLCSVPKLSPLLISSAKTNENNAIPITIINTDDLPLIVFNIAIVSYFKYIVAKNTIFLLIIKTNYFLIINETVLIFVSETSIILKRYFSIMTSSPNLGISSV